jgi:hypothetical protein
VLDWIAFASLASLFVGLLVAIIPCHPAIVPPGRCGKCDYDLTGNLSGICPECGTMTPREARRRHLEQFAPLAEAIQETIVEPVPDEEERATEIEADIVLELV